MYRSIWRILVHVFVISCVIGMPLRGLSAGAQADGEPQFVDERLAGTPVLQGDGSVVAESAAEAVAESSLSARSREALAALQKGQSPPAQALAVLLEEAVELPRAARLVLEATPAPARGGAIFAVISAAASEREAEDVTAIALATLGTNSETVDAAVSALTSNGYGDVDVPALVEAVSAASEQVVGVGVDASEDAKLSEVGVGDGSEGDSTASSDGTNSTTDTADGALPSVGDALGGAGDVSPSG